MRTNDEVLGYIDDELRKLRNGMETSYKDGVIDGLIMVSRFIEDGGKKDHYD